MQQEPTKTNKTNPTNINNQSKEDAMSANQENSNMDLTKNTKQSKTEVKVKTAKENSTTKTNEINSTTTAKKAVKPKKVAKKKYSALEIDFNKTLGKHRETEKEIDQIKQIIKDKQIVIETKDPEGKKITQDLTPAELAGWRNKLAHKKADLKFCMKVLKSFSSRYSIASRKNAAATAAQITRLNVKSRLNNKAQKNSEAIWGLSDSILEELNARNDSRIESLKNVFGQHPQKVNSTWYGILKEELVGVKVADELVLDLLSASPSVRSKLAKRVANKLS